MKTLVWGVQLTMPCGGALLWIGGACLMSFTVAAIFGGRLKMRRNAYLALYVPAVAAYVTWFSVSQGLDIGAELSRHVIWGVTGAVAVGFVVIRNVVNQPRYPRRRGTAFMLDALWPGVAYGLADAALLSVLPVLAVREAALFVAGPTGPGGSIVVGGLGLVASLLLTFCYHVGYPEFRNPRVFWTMYGNGVMTLALLITANPLAALLPHAAMHVTTVWRSRESAGQLPPHNQSNE